MKLAGTLATAAALALAGAAAFALMARLRSRSRRRNSRSILSWPKPLPNNWIFGQIGGIFVDKDDNVPGSASARAR